ncbi:hypothetical protein BRADI_4g25836v3 [Brachypodium distachyon]|uniref:DUF4283 domain-containing protein n=1 Tax=Brachypodium distachyon TaxID=15368 RepID=A0A0Q3PJA4_BRADI|nr:hypothetical protein BRADI_4g25836v3 [Brachypodium distachyon]
MAGIHVLTRKSFGKGTLVATMQSAWGSDREVSICELEPNLFLLQAFYLGDWKRIMEDGPWLFRKCALMTEPYEDAESFVITQLASRVSEVLPIDLAAVPTSCGKFFRVRVRLAAQTPMGTQA